MLSAVFAPVEIGISVDLVLSVSGEVGTADDSSEVPPGNDPVVVSKLVPVESTRVEVDELVSIDVK